MNEFLIRSTPVISLKRANMEGIILVICLQFAFSTAEMKSMKFKKYPVVDFVSSSSPAATSAVFKNIKSFLFLKDKNCNLG